MATDLQRSFDFIHSFEKDFNAPDDRVALEARLVGMGMARSTEEYCRGALDRYERFMLPKKKDKDVKAGWHVCYTVDTEKVKEEEAKKNIGILRRIFNCLWNFLFFTRRSNN